MKNVEERVQEILEPIIQNLRYELYDVEYTKDGKDYFLRIYIDNDIGISLEDCEKVSNSINEILDKAEIIKEQYFLEVSSPGVERILKKDKHLENSIEKEVIVKLFKLYNKTKQINGVLKKFDKDYIYIKSKEELLSIDRKNIAQIKTVYNWN